MLTGEEQQAILDLPCSAAQVNANHDYVVLGESVDHISMIIEGVVGRFDQNSEGDRQITAIQMAGDMIDLQSVVQPHSTSAHQALSAATILRIPHFAVRTATARYPALGEALWRDCMVDAAILAQWVVNVGRRSAKSRIAHLLCEIAVRSGAPTDTGRFSFHFNVTQAQLADATGLTIVHVNRVLKGLQREGLAEVHRPHVAVLDWDALVEVGDFNANYLQMDIRPQDRFRIAQAS